MANPIKSAAKKKAAAQRQGGRYKKAATRMAKKSERSSSKASTSGKRIQQVKAQTRGQSAQNLERAGNKAMTTGQKPASKRSLKVTPRSAHKEIMKNDKYYTGGSSARKVAKGRG